MWMAAAVLMTLFQDLAPPDPIVHVADAAMIESWTADEVQAWAAQHSGAANMLDAERRALGRRCDTNDRKQSAQVGLAQAVLRETAREERNRSAGEALTAYYQIIGLQAQLDLLQEASDELSSLVKFAQRAKEVDLPTGDLNQLRRQQLEIEDQQTQARFGILRLRKHLSGLTGQSEPGTMAAVLSDSLDRPSMQIEDEAAVAEASSNRGLIRAVRTLCRCTNEDSLPAVRRLMGVIQPGLGLAFSGGSSGVLKQLCRLCGLGRQPPSDLSCRRHQCRQLESETYENIRKQVLDAHLNLQQAVARRDIAEETEQLAHDAFDERTKQVDLGQADIGSDRLENLNWIRAKGASIERQVDIAVADVALRQSIGLFVP